MKHLLKCLTIAFAVMFGATVLSNDSFAADKAKAAVTEPEQAMDNAMSADKGDVKADTKSSMKGDMKADKSHAKGKKKTCNPKKTKPCGNGCISLKHECHKDKK